MPCRPLNRVSAFAARQLAPPKARDPRDQGRNFHFFYNLVFKVTYCHFHDILLTGQPWSVWEGTIPGYQYEKMRGIWAILEASCHRSDMNP